MILSRSNDGTKITNTISFARETNEAKNKIQVFFWQSLYLYKLSKVVLITNKKGVDDNTRTFNENVTNSIHF